MVLAERLPTRGRRVEGGEMERGGGHPGKPLKTQGEANSVDLGSFVTERRDRDGVNLDGGILAPDVCLHMLARHEVNCWRKGSTLLHLLYNWELNFCKLNIAE